MSMLHFKTIWRLFLLQNSRNDRTIDGLGFIHALFPVLRDLADDEDQLISMAKRHAEYFNSNPMLASYVLGVVANLETRKKAGEDIPAERIKRVKETLSSVLTAKGDYFFEIVLLPFALTLGSIFAIYGSYIGPIIFLAFYNLYHLQSRIGGYRIGLLLGEDVGRELAAKLFREQGVLSGCSAFVSGIFSALVVSRAWNFGGTRFAVWCVVSVAALLVLRRKISLVWAVLIVFLATVLYLMIS